MNTVAVTAAAPSAVTAESRGLVQWKCHRRLALLAALGFGSGAVAAAGAGASPGSARLAAMTAY